ncbi:MAG: helix-turn-helix domain-containing protein [Lachnospiraceae bacterium]|nr:helix-turn-helix domain-containing protein [Lachnospiraceae bacterium]
MNEEIITIDEMCEILNIGKNTAYRLLANQEIAAFKIGRLWKIPKYSVLEYINHSVSNLQ